MIHWSLKGIKTFKPALKSMTNQDLYGVNPSNHTDDYSVKTKDFWVFSKKLLIIYLVITVIGVFIARTFFLDIAEKFIVKEYDNNYSAPTSSPAYNPNQYD